MREARLILPNADNDGASLAAVHRKLRHTLATAYGGYTATPSQGGWVSLSGELIEEPGTAYDVAVPDGAEDALRSLASAIGEEARQEAIYLRLPSGAVEIIGTAEPAEVVERAA